MSGQPTRGRHFVANIQIDNYKARAIIAAIEGDDMPAILGAVAALVTLGIIVLVGFDLASTPAATTGQCLLAGRIILPDACVNSCTRASDCTATTRPYAIFFTQSATCDAGVICLP